MPEGPEVSYIAFELNQKLKHLQLLEVKVAGGKFEKKPIANLQEFNQKLAEHTVQIEEIKCRGKLLYFSLSHNLAMISTLGLSGRWRFKDSDHTHLHLKYTGGTLFYSDVRRFGNFYLYLTHDSAQTKFKSLAPDFLNDKIALSEFTWVFKSISPKLYLAKVLMDQQKLCSGIGNYILAEVLYICGLNPWVKVGELLESDIRNLYQACLEVTRKAYKLKGNSIRDYQTTEGESGQFQRRLKVYNQRKDPEGNTVKRVPGPHGRTIHYVPEKQPRRIRLLVSGSRNLEDESLVEFGIDVALHPYLKDSPQITLIQGECRGVDTLAKGIAVKRGWKVMSFPYIQKLGRAGGPVRNQQMLVEGKPHVAVLFLTQESKGTRSMLNLIEKHPVERLLILELN